MVVHGAMNKLTRLIPEEVLNITCRMMHDNGILQKATSSHAKNITCIIQSLLIIVLKKYVTKFIFGTLEKLLI